MKKSHTDHGQSVAAGIFNTSTYFAASAAELEERFLALLGLKELPPGANPFIYGRFGSPNSESVEWALTEYENGATGALVFPAGMAAIFTTLFSILKPGDVVLYTNPVYGCTDDMFRQYFDKWGVEAIAVDTSDLAEVSKYVDIHKERLAAILIESPSNPIIRLSDIRGVADILKNTGLDQVKLVVDSTFLGPLYQQPLMHGADIAIHSATKFLGGHSDIIGGVVFTADPELLTMIKNCRSTTGPIMSPETCWLLERSLETLEIRMAKQTELCQAVVKVLVTHPKIEKVYYPGLLSPENDPDQYAIYQRQCLAPGSMVSFDVKGGKEAAFRVHDALKEFFFAVSLGGTHHLVEHPATTSHAAVPPDVRMAGGLTDSLLRLSLGVGKKEKVVNDVRQACNQA